LEEEAKSSIKEVVIPQPEPPKVEPKKKSQVSTNWMKDYKPIDFEIDQDSKEFYDKQTELNDVLAQGYHYVC
jgi:hypothetical protein